VDDYHDERSAMAGLSPVGRIAQYFASEIAFARVRANPIVRGAGIKPRQRRPEFDPSYASW